MNSKKIIVLISLFLLSEFSYAAALGCRVIAQDNIEPSYELSALEEKNFRAQFSLCESSHDKLYFLILELLPTSQDIAQSNIINLPYKEHHLMQTNLRSDIWIRKISAMDYKQLKTQFSTVFDKKIEVSQTGSPDEKNYSITRTSDQSKFSFTLTSGKLDAPHQAILKSIVDFCENSFPTALKSDFEPSEVNYFLKKPEK